jgi:hypothetical protein
VQIRTKTTIVHGAGGKVWRDDGSQWFPFLDKVRAIAYPG